MLKSKHFFLSHARTHTYFSSSSSSPPLLLTLSPERLLGFGLGGQQEQLHVGTAHIATVPSSPLLLSLFDPSARRLVIMFLCTVAFPPSLPPLLKPWPVLNCVCGKHRWAGS